MTPQDYRGEYMKNVKWTTAGIVLSSTISVIVAIVWFCSDLKSDISVVRTEVKDARTEAKEQLTAAVVSIHKTIDSNEFHHREEMTAVWTILNQHGHWVPSMGMATQKVIIVNGKRVVEWTPLK